MRKMILAGVLAVAAMAMSTTDSMAQSRITEETEKLNACAFMESMIRESFVSLLMAERTEQAALKLTYQNYTLIWMMAYDNYGCGSDIANIIAEPLNEAIKQLDTQ